jgi:hypothetical protein
LTLPPDVWDSAASQVVSYAFSFFWLDGFAVPAPAQVTQTVGQTLRALKKQKNSVYFW